MVSNDRMASGYGDGIQRGCGTALKGQNMTAQGRDEVGHSGFTITPKIIPPRRIGPKYFPVDQRVQPRQEVVVPVNFFELFFHREKTQPNLSIATSRYLSTGKTSHKTKYIQNEYSFFNTKNGGTWTF